VTSRDYAMVWDEGHTVRRERTLADWFSRVAAGGPARSKAFSRAALESSWPFSREEPDGHTPFYALLGLVGWWSSHRWVDPLTAYRFGPMVLASFTIGVVYLHLAGRRGRIAGLVGAGSMALLPHLFSLSHYAHYDMPVTCLWLITQIAFLNSLRSRRWRLLMGLAFGLAVGTKFTGIFAIVPPLLWVVFREWLPRIRFAPALVGDEAESQSSHFRGTSALFVAGFVAALTLYAIHPPWWSDPVAGVSRFVASNLTRAQTKPIPTMYLGEFYAFALPWHNTLVLNAVSVPVLTLLLGLSGVVAIVGRRSRDPEGWLWIFSWATLMIVRALPMTPGQDGVRLFLPSIASLCILAGIGAQAFVSRGKTWIGKMLGGLLIAGCLAEPLIGIYELYPFTLSYYNKAIGGLPGAERVGFELTYYWDTMGQEFFGRVREQRKKRALELRFPSTLVNIAFLREWGDLPGDVKVMAIDPGTQEADYVLQTRRGHFHPYDLWLDRSGKPTFTIRRQGVDLVRVYPYEESLKAFLNTREAPFASHLRR